MDSLNQLNRELAGLIRKGDKQAFDKIYELYAQRLYGFAFSILKNKEDAKEVVQETFLKIWNKRETINTRYSFKAFIFTVSYNIIIDLLKERSSNLNFQKYLKDNFTVESLQTDELVHFEDLKDKLNHLVNKLPKKRKQIYLLSREEGLSHHEIANKLGVTVKTVENQINLTLKYFRSNLDFKSLIIIIFFTFFD